MCHARCLPRRRAAFTLIEMLVVMALILGVTALGIGYVVFSTSHETAVKGAQAVTGALLDARQRARRDSLPTGVRILFGTNNLLATQSNQLQFIQQPDDYNQGVCQGNPPMVPATNPATLNLNELLFNTGGTNSQGFATGVDFQGGANYIGEIDESTVQAGDYFTLSTPPTPHRINSVLIDPVSGLPALKLDSPVAVPSGSSYSIIRAPRRLPSEDIITLPANLVIDNRNGLCQNLPQRYLIDSNNPNGVPVSEILFAPSGGVVGQGTGADKVYLWLADPTQAAGAGSSLILSVQIRTGMIGVYPVAPWNSAQPISATNDPYAYVKDPRASGL